MGQQGFTFLELLLVVAPLAALSGIAIQSMAGTQGTAYDARARHDLAAAVRAEMAHYAETGSYRALSVTGPAKKTGLPGAVVSATVTLDVKVSADAFKAKAVSSLGTGKVYEYDSDSGTFTASGSSAAVVSTRNAPEAVPLKPDTSSATAWR